jgi:gliding motility-associated-like protein
MKYLLPIILLLAGGNAFSQSVICPYLSLTKANHDTIQNHLDTIHCGNPCETLHAIPSTYLNATSTYTVTSIPYSPFSFTAGTNVPCTICGGLLTTYDDEFGNILPLPFNFCFFGTTYNQLVVGTNGNITFNSALNNSYDPWPISGPLPGSNCNATFNCIMAPWNDLYPPAGGSIKYAVYGTAPCRQFVVTWNAVPLFNTGICPGMTSTQQAVLYESSNVIDINIANRVSCSGWNGGLAVTGIENPAGTLFYTAPGENGTTFTATNQAWRFTPNGGASPWTFTWYDSTKTTVVATADSALVCPSVDSWYFVKATSTACTGIVVWDSVKMIFGGRGVGHIDSTAFANPSSCLTSDGWILFHGMPPGDTVWVSYTYNGRAFGPLVEFPNSDSDIIFTGLGAGIYNNFYFKHDSCLVGPIGPFNLTLPPISISHEVSSNPSICGECNGTITLYGLPPGSPFSLSYRLGTTPQPTLFAAAGIDSSIHLINLCAGTYNTFVAAIGTCTTTAAPVTLTNPPPIPASFTYDVKLGCQGDEVILHNTSTPSGFTSNWSFGDGTFSSITAPTHIYLDTPGYTGTYTIQLTYSSYGNPACRDSTTKTVTFNHPIDAGITSNKDTICLGDSIVFTSHTISNDGPTYLWNFGNGVTSTATNPVYTYPVAGNYIALLTVTDTIGCSRTATENTQVVSIAVHTSVSDTAMCLRDSMVLHAFVSVKPDNTIPFVYSWTQWPDIGNFLSYDSTANPHFFSIGTYVYTVTVTTNYVTSPDILNCVAHDTERITSYPPVTLINLTADATVSYGSSIQLNANGATYYTWTPNDGTLSNPNINNPIATPVDTTTVYTVYGMNPFGCLDSASLVIRVDDAMLETLPTAFTPNGDGLNDVFRLAPKMKFQKLVQFNVFNRWGQIIFSTSDADKGWDGTFNGTPQDFGVYHYEVIVAHPDGTNKVYKGDVTLIR